MKKILYVVAALCGFFVVNVLATTTNYKTFTDGSVLTAAELNSLQTNYTNADNAILDGDIFTGNMLWYSGADALFYSDTGSTQKASILGESGLFTTVGGVQLNSTADVNIYSDVGSTLRASLDGSTGNYIGYYGADINLYSDSGSTLTFSIDGTTGDIGFASGRKFYYDGATLTGNTYTTEASPDSLQTYVGGEQKIIATASDFQVIDSVSSGSTNLTIKNSHATSPTAILQSNLNRGDGSYSGPYLKFSGSGAAGAYSSTLDIYADDGASNLYGVATFSRSGQASNLILRSTETTGDPTAVISASLNRGDGSLSGPTMTFNGSGTAGNFGSSITVVTQDGSTGANVTNLKIENGGVTLSNFANYTTTGSTANVFANTSTGLLSQVVSSIRYKKNVRELDFDSSAVYDLNPVSYEDKASNETYFGLIAEEVEEVLPELVSHRDDGAPQSVNYDHIGVLLIAELKKLRDENYDLRDRIEKLESRLQ